MFDLNELDENGDVAPPYNIEKYNFNAHKVAFPKINWKKGEVENE